MNSRLFMSKKRNKRKESIELATQAGATTEVVGRYGSASKQHLVAYSGQDNEVGKTRKRGLKKTSESKVNPEYREQNIKQQAGFAAEDKYTARQNAEKVINGDKTRYARTDDLGRVNDPLYDHILLDENGIEIPGTGEQMKFVGSSPKTCLNKLESKEFQKYLDADARITVPSDYYKDIIQEADNRILSLEKQLARAKENNNSELAESISKKIDKVHKIKKSVKNSGITNKDAIFARMHPKLSTAKDMVKISHRAGIEQAKTGALIGGSISLIKNVVAVSKGEKDATSAAKDFIKDTGKGAITAYATAFAGSAIKAGMQNSRNSTIRVISKGNAPAAIITSTIDVSKSLISYAKGDISGADCLAEIGEKGAGNMSAVMFSIVGQTIIPIPVIGAMVGSIIGYTLSSTFYNTLRASLKEAQVSHEKRIRVEKECTEAIEMISLYRAEMNALAQKYLSHYRMIFDETFRGLDEAFLSNDINLIIENSNKITIALGGTPQFHNMEQFNDFMESNENFNL